jgi:dTDP-4-amino-4,6-dideoxygalactose transaminase
MKVPLLDLKKEYQFLKKDIQKQLDSCFKSQQWILGPKVEEFEKKAAKYLKTKHAIGVASGTDALVLSLRALALKTKKKAFFAKKDEIITTPFTFIATAESIKRSGATPVFVDIDPDTFNIDPDKIKTAITKNTVGILPVHLYGLACDMNKILRIAKEHNLFVVEDTAQAFGAVYHGKKLGSLGDCGAYSFFPSKNLGGCGDGGLVSTNDSKLASLIRVLRNHGQTKRYNAEFAGYNSRLDSIQAAVLLAKLKHIDKFNRARRAVAGKYNKSFKGLVGTPLESKDCRHAYHLYTIKVSSRIRNKLFSYLNSQGISSRVYYPGLLPEMTAFKNTKLKLNKAKKVSQEVLSLPIHPFLTDRDISYITKNLRAFFKSRS